MNIRNAVLDLAQTVVDFDDATMGGDYAWRYHGEGLRMALLGTHHELRDLAARLMGERGNAGIPVTETHHILAQYHLAYWDCRAVYFPVNDGLFEKMPAENEWSLRTTLGHMVIADHMFYALVNYALRRARGEDSLPVAVPKDLFDQTHQNATALDELVEKGSLSAIMAEFEGFHDRVLGEFAGIPPSELESPTLWWEQDNVPNRFRLHRFDAHLRQHTIQAEKTLLMLDQPPTESHRLIRLLFSGLADVENRQIGSPDLNSDLCQATATIIQKRTAQIKFLRY